MILVDMDGVLADFDRGFLKMWRAQYPDKPYVPIEDRNGFHITEQYPADSKELVRGIYRSPDFYPSLPSIAGGLEAISEMSDRGFDVFICTSLLPHYETCVLEKYQWIERHLGRAWTNRIIITNDKTLVRGDILIDDKPEIKGVTTPSWEHVIFDQPYNRHISTKRRLNWQNWRAVLNL